MRPDGETNDTDTVLAAIDNLTIFEPGHPGVEILTHCLLDLRGSEILKHRHKQRMQLARYARESYFVWDDVDVVELERCYAELVTIVQDENSIHRVSEDRG